MGKDGADISGTPPAPAATPFQFNFGAPATTVASTTAGLGSLKLGQGVKLNDGDDDDDDDEDDEDDDENEDDAAALAAVMEQMPAVVLARVIRLKSLDNERDEILKEYEKERKVRKKQPDFSEP